jgi:predicted O-methyltransferase YrrM
MISGSREQMLVEAQALCQDDLAAVLAEISHAEGMMLDWQCAWLYTLARPFDGGKILEIGTYKGKSALVLALACPRAHIVTLTVHAQEAQEAARVLAGRGVEMHTVRSWDYLAGYKGPDLDMVFVDGDHNQVRRDLTWFNRIRVGGLMLFHDWSAVGSDPVQASYRAINAFATGLRRQPDVQLVDAKGVGMAGFYRRRGELA